MQETFLATFLLQCTFENFKWGLLGVDIFIFKIFSQPNVETANLMASTKTQRARI